jgi:hypothetical protein
MTGALHITLTTSSSVGLINLTRIDDGFRGCNTNFFHDSVSPAALDQIASFLFKGRNSAGSVTSYGGIYSEIVDPTWPNPKGRLVLRVLGTTGTAEADLVHGLHVIAGGIDVVADKGGTTAGTIWVGGDVTISSARKLFCTGMRIEGLTTPNGKILTLEADGDVVERALTELAAQIDFHSLASATPASDDEIVIWDTSAGSYKKSAISGLPSGEGGGGVTDHGALTGLSDDDHNQYLTTTRHDTTDRHALGTVVPHDTFLGLTDTPVNYTGAAGKTVVVNQAGNGIEFVAASGGGNGGPWFGDGCDGDIALDGTNTFSWASKSGSPAVYTLNRPVYADDITITNGAEINTNGYHLYISGTVTGALVCRSNGGAGGVGQAGNSGGTGGSAGAAAHAAGSLPAALAGRAGGLGYDSGYSGTAGNAQTNCDTLAAQAGSAGGRGGNYTASPPTNGSAAAGGTVTKLSYSDRSTMSLATMRIQVGATLGQWSLHGGGGSGGGGAYVSDGYSGGGGGSGGNGGNSVICVRTVAAGSSITQECKGGAGGGGGAGYDSHAGGGGGGAGGSGGVAILIYGENGGTITQAVTGGTGGTGGAGSGTGQVGESGGNGPAGLAIQICTM